MVSEKSTVDDIVMSDTSRELNEVVVTGVFSGQQRAINAQKNNINITNVVSADQIGKFPDSNIGDALKRISGINVQYDQGEARFGQVRGTPAEFSSVTINGSRLPSAEGDIRNVQLDLIPSDMIQTIEVSKTLMPDQGRRCYRRFYQPRYEKFATQIYCRSRSGNRLQLDKP